MLKIGTGARTQIEALLGSKVYLELWVKVKKDWRNKDGSLAEFGYSEDTQEICPICEVYGEGG